MSKLVLGSVIAVTVAAGLGIGWALGAPAEERPPGLTFVIAEVSELVRGQMPDSTAKATPEEAGQTPPGEDTAPGWTTRNRLRDQMTDAMAVLKSAPCDPDKRAAFLNAYYDLASARMDDARAVGHGDAAPFWTTSDDRAIDQQMTQFQARGFVTDEMIGKTMMNRRMGAQNVALLVAIQRHQDLEKGRTPIVPAYDAEPAPSPYCQAQLARASGHASQRDR